ncbi:hypothetical protein Avbf_08585 [Armadillidium vulgare]|nr:hypothetical protein Avbf_08585 [Armadillidium vulgare]
MCVEESNEEMVVLRNVKEDTSGVYKCEVMGEGPAFRTAVDTMEMHVIVPPERVEITHGLNRNSIYQYKIEDIISLNCTAHRAKPRPHLVWRINGQEAKRSEFKRYYPDFEDQEGKSDF